MTSVPVAIYSNTFLEGQSDKWSASPSTSLLSHIHATRYDSARWIAFIKGSAGEIRVALGDPVNQIGSSRTKDLFIPSWLLSTIGVEGVGEEILVKFERCEDFQKAQSLTFTYLGELPSEIDLKDLLETPLSQLGVLTKGQILPVPVLEGSLIVSQCEPEGVPVFLDGNEIAFDIQGDVPPPPPTPAPVPESTPQPSHSPEGTYSGMLPASLLQENHNTTPYREQTTSNRGRFANKSTFIPFGGQGRTLGS
jgi:hypothetical protein